MKSFVSTENKSFLQSGAGESSQLSSAEMEQASFQDKRSDAQLQLKQIREMNNGSLMSAQLLRQEKFIGGTAQKMGGPEEEELLQGKFIAQKMDGPEEEELLQGKFAAQKMGGPEEEELLQGKLVAQKMGGPEEEELLQGKFAAQKMGGPEEEELLQGKFVIQQMDGPEEEELLQGKMNTPQPLQRSENNTGMPDEVKTRMESTFNTDFSDVNIHSNSSSAPEVGALAYAQGNDVHFAPGQFKPNTSQGQELLGHELTHVVQQREGRVSPTTEANGMPVNDDPKLEAEADTMGKKAAQWKKKK